MIRRRLAPPTSSSRRRLLAVALAAATLSPALAGRVAAAPPVADRPDPAARTLTGSLADGATWQIRVPEQWNGTLLLFSHDLVPPGEDNPAQDAPDPLTGDALLAAGYALAGSSYATTGFAIEDAFTDQLATLDVFRQQVGRPTRTIAWGSSLGGAVTLTPPECWRSSECRGVGIRLRHTRMPQMLGWDQSTGSGTFIPGFHFGDCGLMKL